MERRGGGITYEAGQIQQSRERAANLKVSAAEVFSEVIFEAHTNYRASQGAARAGRGNTTLG